MHDMLGTPTPNAAGSLWYCGSTFYLCVWNITRAVYSKISGSGQSRYRWLYKAMIYVVAYAPNAAAAGAAAGSPIFYYTRQDNKRSFRFLQSQKW